MSLIDFSWPELVSYERFLTWSIRIVNFRSVWDTVCFLVVVFEDVRN